MPPFQGGHNVCCNISLSRCDLPHLSPMRAARLCLSHAVLLSFMSHSVGGCLRQREASVPCDSDTPEPARRSVGMTRSRRCVALDQRRERDMVGGRRSRPRTRIDSALPVQAPNRARARACRRGRQVAVGRRLRPLTGNMRLSAERKCGPARTRQECDEGGNTDKARVRTGLGRWRGMRRVWGRRGQQGTGFTPDDTYSYVEDVALFWARSPVGTDRDAPLAARYHRCSNFCAHPPALGDSSAGQLGRRGPDSLGVAPPLSPPSPAPQMHRPWAFSA